MRARRRHIVTRRGRGYVRHARAVAMIGLEKVAPANPHASCDQDGLPARNAVTLPKISMTEPPNAIDDGFSWQPDPEIDWRSIPHIVEGAPTGNGVHPVCCLDLGIPGSVRQLFGAERTSDVRQRLQT
jgi:hypothetical protein